jgi:hypothetical protein
MEGFCLGIERMVGWMDAIILPRFRFPASGMEEITRDHGVATELFRFQRPDCGIECLAALKLPTLFETPGLTRHHPLS